MQQSTLLSLALFISRLSAAPNQPAQSPSVTTHCMCSTTTIWGPTMTPMSPRPVTPPPTCKNKVSQNANFDDLTFITGVQAVNTLPVPYKGLNFQGFKGLGIVKTNLLPGDLPHSGTQYAYSDATTTTLAGSAEWTTLYPDSNIKSFSPKSFYYGCATETNTGATALPAACNIAITGYRQGDNTAAAVAVVSQQFSFNPSTTTGPAQLTQGVFSAGFTELEYVLIQYTTPGGAALTGALLELAIDDVVYDTCTF